MQIVQKSWKWSLNILKLEKRCANQTNITFLFQVNNDFILAVERESFVDQVREIIEKADEMLSEDVSVEPEGDQETLQGKDDYGFSGSQVGARVPERSFVYLKYFCSSKFATCPVIPDYTSDWNYQTFMFSLHVVICFA